MHIEASYAMGTIYTYIYIYVCSYTHTCRTQLGILNSNTAHYGGFYPTEQTQRLRSATVTTGKTYSVF